MTKRLGPNIELIRSTVKLIEENEENFNMNSWLNVPINKPICKTTLCFAGFVVANHMGPSNFFNRFLIYVYYPKNTWIANSTSTNGVLQIANIAQRLLRLNNSEADKIFYCGGPTIKELKDKITEVLGITFEDENDS